MDEIATTPVLAFQASTEKTVQSFIDYSRFSKWTRILRTTAYVMRAARNFKDKRLHSRNENPTTELTSNNMIVAKNLIFKQTQRDSFNPEDKALTQIKPINTTSRLQHLSPFLDEDGLLRARGRLEKSQLDYCRKPPSSSPLYGTYPQKQPAFTKPALKKHSSKRVLDSLCSRAP